MNAIMGRLACLWIVVCLSVVTVAAQSAPPQITANPISTSALLGGSASVSVTATGTAPLTYQWYRNGTAITGATGSFYLLTSALFTDAGSYTVTVTNQFGSTTSQAAILSVGGMPVILQQPASLSALVGSTVSFSVAAVQPTTLSYQWYFYGQPIPGATASVYSIAAVKNSDAGNYAVTVSNGTSGLYSDTAVLTVLGAAPSFTTPPVSQTVAIGTTASFSAVVAGTGPLTYQWYFNGNAIAGATNLNLSVPEVTSANVGSYTLSVTGPGGSITSPAAILAIKPTSYAGDYFGTLTNGGRWAMYVGASNTGFYIAYLGANSGALVYGIMVNPDGTFNSAPPVQTSATPSTSLAFQIAAGVVTGQVNGLGLSLNGAQDIGAANAAIAGFYSASALNGARGSTYTVVGGSGQTFMLNLIGAAADYAVGVVASTGQLSAQTAAGGTMSMKIAPGTLLASTTITPSGSTTPITYAGLASQSTSTTRLLNVSVRGVAGSGANVLIGGFVVTGGTKQMLVRGIGPTLTGFGIAGALPNPLMTLFGSDSSVLVSSGPWGGAASLTSVFNRVGAFALAANSADSASVQSVAGNATLQVTPSSGSSGVALAEIYDADTTGSSARLVNLSGRSNTGTGSSVLSAGFVVGGVGTETLLLRGIGPTLGTLGVAGAVPTVQLTLFDSSNTAIATNITWGGDTALAAAFTQVGAFALPANSKDAALLATLLPGNYTVQVAGLNNATGVALVEIYEVK